METNENSNILSCKICLFSYDDETHNPKVLLCGHTLCQSCFTCILTEKTYKCPFCKKEFNKNTEPVVNYEVLSMLHYKKFDNSCTIHNKELLNFYCEDDKILI